MSQHEKAILLEGGALGVDEDSEQLARSRGSAIAQLAQEWELVKKEALDEAGVAALLGISRGKLHQLVTTRPPTLFVIGGDYGDLLFPKWQFEDDRLIPHLGDLLQAFSSETHPLSIYRFMTMANQDLESPDFGILYTPRDWLLKGFDPAPVMLMALDI